MRISTPSARETLLTPPRHLPALLDSDEKLIEAMQDPAVAQLAGYYQALFTAKFREAITRHHARKERTDYDAWFSLEKFPELERRRIVQNLGSAQLTQGCTGKCPGCGVDAAPNVQMTVPFPMLEAFVRYYTLELRASKPFWYWASDIGNYPWYAEAEKLFSETLGYLPFVSTIGPKGSEEMLRSMGVDKRVVGFRLSQMECKEEDQRKRGVLDLGNKRLHRVQIGNMSARNAETDNTGTAWGQRWGENGIGCYQGALLTPFGAYAVAQCPGIHEEAPQKQFIVPYEGPGKTLPETGQDMRQVLSSHLPLLFRTRISAIESFFPCACGQRETDCFIVIDDPRKAEDKLVVVYRGPTVVDVQSVVNFGVPDREDPSQRRMLQDEITIWRDHALVSKKRHRESLLRQLKIARDDQNTNYVESIERELACLDETHRHRIAPYEDPVSAAYLGLRSLFRAHVWGRPLAAEPRQ